MKFILLFLIFAVTCANNKPSLCTRCMGENHKLRIGETCWIGVDCSSSYCVNSTCLERNIDRRYKYSRNCNHNADCSKRQYCNTRYCADRFHIGLNCRRNSECLGNKCVEKKCV